MFWSLLNILYHPVLCAWSQILWQWGKYESSNVFFSFGQSSKSVKKTMGCGNITGVRGLFMTFNNKGDQMLIFTPSTPVLTNTEFIHTLHYQITKQFTEITSGTFWYSCLFHVYFILASRGCAFTTSLDCIGGSDVGFRGC